MEFLAENLATILVGLAVLAALVWAVARLVKDHREGKSVCGGCAGGCSGCPSAGMCHQKQAPSGGGKRED